MYYICVAVVALLQISVCNGEVPLSLTAPEGCAILFNSDPHTSPNTLRRVVCANDLDIIPLTSRKFDMFESTGNSVSYIITGKNAWVTLADRENLHGATLTIGPEKLADINKIHRNRPEIANLNPVWNDKIESLIVRTYQPIVGYPFAGKPDMITSRCVGMFGSNPVTNPETKGFVVCLDDAETQQDVTFDWLLEHGLDPESFNGGISYVKAGTFVDVTLYKERIPGEGNSHYTIYPGKHKDLTVNGWSDRAFSFVISTGGHPDSKDAQSLIDESALSPVGGARAMGVTSDSSPSPPRTIEQLQKERLRLGSQVEHTDKDIAKLEAKLKWEAAHSDAKVTISEKPKDEKSLKSLREGNRQSKQLLKDVLGQISDVELEAKSNEAKV